MLLDFADAIRSIFLPFDAKHSFTENKNDYDYFTSTIDPIL